MACGKSTLGKVLSEKLGFELIDTDSAIEQLCGRTIKELFEEYGEQWFRDQETRLLNFTRELDKVIISTGGGMPCDIDNLDLMLNNGLTIYLELEPKKLAQRILGNGTRPLHQESDLESLEKSVKRKLATRQVFYREAHITLDGNKSTNLLVEELQVKIQGAL